jgi:hypothetical protein
MLLGIYDLLALQPEVEEQIPAQFDQLERDDAGFIHRGDVAAWPELSALLTLWTQTKRTGCRAPNWRRINSAYARARSLIAGRWCHCAKTRSSAPDPRR